MSEFPWCQDFSDVRISLMSGFLWYQHFPDVRISPLSGFLWYQHFPDVRISLVISGPPTSAVLWYQHSSGISAGLSVDLPLLLNSRALDMHVAVLDCTRSSAPDCLAWHFHGVHAGTVERAVCESHDGWKGHRDYERRGQG
jgi:hypothetical protein